MRISFIGGGNMATALIGGLIRTGVHAGDIHAVEVDEARRNTLHYDFGITVAAAPDVTLKHCDVLLLAVKPQDMRAACLAAKSLINMPLVLSIAAGIRAFDIARWFGTSSVVRAMPNTPALIGKGITGMAALDSVLPQEREVADRILRTVGQTVWFDREDMLDPVTAISGSGPAYVFFFLEAMQQAGIEMGFSPAQARALAVQTFVGAADLAAASEEPFDVLREKVTSKGGTTAAALESMNAHQVKAHLVEALHAAHWRAKVLGVEFGADQTGP